MVYVRSLNKNIWPYYIPPYKDELFTSWIYRLSIKSSVKPIPFVNNCFGRDRAFWNRDIDLRIPDEIVNKVLIHTPLKSREDIVNMSLESYAGRVFETLKVNTYTPGISSIGIKHRKRKQFGLSFCPKCISKNYFQKSWRLETSVVCLDCNSLLLDRCPKCGAPISFHRINVGRKSKFDENMFTCSNCKFDLRKSNIKDQSSEELSRYQRFIDKTIEEGYNHITTHSFTYIRILLHLCSKWMTSNDSNLFRSNFQKYYDVKINNEGVFRFAPIDEKRKVLEKVNLMLMNWPYSFLEIRKMNHFNNSHIIDNLNKAPYWFKYYLIFDS